MEDFATASTNWIDLGDRSHPNLKLVDKLKRKLTYDGHKNDLKELEQAHFGRGRSFDNILRRVREKEKMSKGDRSHPNLVRLDKLMKNVTYDGWRDDFRKAEHKHLHHPFIFDSVLKEIERKQKISIGDRSDEELKVLDSLSLSYPGWKRDWQEAFRGYIQGFSLDYLQIIFCLNEKQRMHNGDRSHPRLVALDTLQLSYPGWEKDVKKYEKRHTCSQLRFGFLGETEARKEIEILKCKQKSYCYGVDDLSWMASDQRTIVNAQWTFHGWKKAVQKVREMTIPGFDFGDTLEHFQVRQLIHNDDYSHHPLLVALSSMKLSYPSWEEDFGRTKRKLNRTSSLFWKDTLEMNIQGMRKKQTVYDGYVRSLKKESKPKSKSMSKQKDEEETGLKECVVCWVARRTHVFVPCGHMCACKACSDHMLERRKICPTCNQPSTMAIEVFVP
ncbi:hypothetical protein ACHAWT_008586 [Skeletonema menzelii]